MRLSTSQSAGCFGLPVRVICDRCAPKVRGVQTPVHTSTRLSILARRDWIVDDVGRKDARASERLVGASVLQDRAPWPAGRVRLWSPTATDDKFDLGACRKALSRSGTLGDDAP